MRFGVGPTRELLDRLGAPDGQLPIVLVGGTNGKGSVAATLAAIASCGGWRVGLFTSPHLEQPRERIRIDGVAVAAAELDQLVAAAIGAAVGPEQQPTYFEATTVAALLAFAKHQCDLAVLEVGLGGRLDATNAVEPALSVIAAISRDHESILGEGLAAIAAEKAGIMRVGRPALMVPGAPVVERVLGEQAARIGARLERLDLPAGLADGLLTIRGRHGTYRARPGLAGAHQLLNLSLAVRSAELLDELGLAAIDRKAITTGLAAVRWPGRLERIGLDKEREVILDGAHNPAGVAALLEALDGSEPFTLIFAALSDKPAAQMLRPLAARAASVVLTRPLGTTRAIAPATLAELLPAGSAAALAEDPPAALELALHSKGRRIVVAGSLYLIGEMRGALFERFGRPLPAAETSTVAVANLHSG